MVAQNALVYMAASAGRAYARLEPRDCLPASCANACIVHKRELSALPFATLRRVAPSWWCQWRRRHILGARPHHVPLVFLRSPVRRYTTPPVTACQRHRYPVAKAAHTSCHNAAACRIASRRRESQKRIKDGRRQSRVRFLDERRLRCVTQHALHLLMW